MKSIFCTLLLTSLSIISFSQNIIYIERLNDLTYFTNGQGSVNVQSVGVNPNLDVYVKYNQLIAGNPVSTGWISYSGQTITDIYGNIFEACAIFPETGDTLVKCVQQFGSSKYEVSSISTQGFDEYGQNDIYGNEPWEIQINFDGPDLNCDAYATDMFQQSSNASNNQLIIQGPFPFYNPEIYFNQEGSLLTFLIQDTIMYDPIYSTGTQLNAYIPRVINRPTTNSDCDGSITFERVSMTSDIELYYAINNLNFQPLSNDTFSGICATDTIHVIGFSPTVLSGDTLVETVYVLKSEEDPYAPYFDLSNVEVTLNETSTGSNCNNTLSFISNDPNSGWWWGLLENSHNEYLYLDIFSDESSNYWDMCQDKYTYYEDDYDGEELVNLFTFTVLDVNNELHDLWYDFSIEPSYSDTGNCQTNLEIINTGKESYGVMQFIKYDTGQNSFESNTPVDQRGFSSHQSYTDLCPGLYKIDYFNKKAKFYVVTDSLQKRYTKDVGLWPTDEYINNELVYRNYSIVSDIDTIIHYYSECTNDYNAPFNLMDFDTTILKPSIQMPGGYFNPTFHEYACNFHVEQNGSIIDLPERNVLAPVYYNALSYEPEIPYYTIAELYCDDEQKSTASVSKRRRIIVHPGGEVEDLYNGSNTTATDHIQNSKFEIFPNPAKESFTVTGVEEGAEIELFNYKGVRIDNWLASNNKTYNVANLQNGFYILKVQGTKSSRTIKLLVTH